MQELHRQHPELMEAERAIFAGAEGGEVIALSSDDEVEDGEDGGAEGGEVLRSPPMIRSKAAAARRASRWALRTRRSTSTSGGVPSPMTLTTVLARTRHAVHRT